VNRGAMIPVNMWCSMQGLRRCIAISCWRSKFGDAVCHWIPTSGNWLPETRSNENPVPVPHEAKAGEISSASGAARSAHKETSIRLAMPGGKRTRYGHG